MSTYKIITQNGSETLAVKMREENMAIVCTDRKYRKEYQIIHFNPREAWELHDFIHTHGAPRPFEQHPVNRALDHDAEYLRTVFCKVNEEPVTPASSLPPVQGVDQDTIKNPCPEQTGAGSLDSPPYNREKVESCWKEECDGCSDEEVCWPN